MRTELYIQQIIDAGKRTAIEKYLVPEELKLLGKFKPYQNDEFYEQIAQLFMKRFGEPDGTIDLTKVKGQCMNFHLQMASILLQYFGISTILTIGYVTIYGKDFYKFENLDNSLLKKLPNSEKEIMDIHAWLTLPSFEIIDMIFLAHIHYVNASSELKEKLKNATDYPYFFGSAESLYSEWQIEYHPKYLGEDVLIKNGFRKF